MILSSKQLIVCGKCDTKQHATINVTETNEMIYDHTCINNVCKNKLNRHNWKSIIIKH